MMVRVSEWTFYNVNLGGIAEAARFCPMFGAEAFFVSPIKGRAADGPSIDRPKHKFWR